MSNQAGREGVGREPTEFDIRRAELVGQIGNVSEDEEKVACRMWALIL